MKNKMEIIITNKEGLRQVSSFSEEKIKYITETNQWDNVIKEMLKHITITDINTFIPSFGDFMIYCGESDIEKDLFLELIFEFLNNPKKYNNQEIIKEYLSEKLDKNSYIKLINKINL